MFVSSVAFDTTNIAAVAWNPPSWAIYARVIATLIRMLTKSLYAGIRRPCRTVSSVNSDTIWSKVDRRTRRFFWNQPSSEQPSAPTRLGNYDCDKHQDLLNTFPGIISQSENSGARRFVSAAVDSHQCHSDACAYRHGHHCNQFVIRINWKWQCAKTAVTFWSPFRLFFDFQNYCDLCLFWKRRCWTSFDKERRTTVTDYSKADGEKRVAPHFNQPLTCTKNLGIK